MEKLVKHTKTAAEERMPFGGGLLLLSEAERYAHIRAPIILTVAPISFVRVAVLSMRLSRGCVRAAHACGRRRRTG